MAIQVQPDSVVERAWYPRSKPQEALVVCPIEDVFYGGARGGGKTDGLLGDFALHAGKYGKHAHGILFRRTYPELEEVERRSREIFTSVWGPKAYNETKKTWTAPNGAQLKLRYLMRDSDADNYQGHSYTWQGWDELTNWASSTAIDKLWATLRSAHGVPCYRRSTGNPGGVGHGWVKRRYIDPAPDGYEVFSYFPNADKMPGVSVQCVFIPSKLDDNQQIASQGYEARIAAAVGDNEALWEAWRFGRWDVFVGQQYAEFRREFHVLKNKRPEDFPRNTEWFATLDWGYNQGCYGLHAVDNEHRVELVWEFYDGFRHLDAESAAIAIIEAQTKQGWPLPKLIHGDEQMMQRIGTAVTLAESFREGLSKVCKSNAPMLIEARHPPKSREVKVATIHEWLTVGKKPGTREPATDEYGALLPWAAPYYRIHERCENTIRVLQEIPSDPDNPNDVDPDYLEDHPHDMVGFAVACRPPLPVQPLKYSRHEDTTGPVDYSTGRPKDSNKDQLWERMRREAKQQNVRTIKPRRNNVRTVPL